MGCSFSATSHILLFGADTKANNMSTKDDCFLGACNLMVFKQSDVSNEHAAMSILLHFKNQTRASLNDHLNQNEVDATENINGNSNIFNLGTASISRYPLREKSNCHLIKIAGTLSLEAVDALHSNFAVNNECRKYKKYTWRISVMLPGIEEMSFESPILCFATGCKISTLQKVKTP
jgi:hypothetical protein